MGARLPRIAVAIATSLAVWLIYNSLNSPDYPDYYAAWLANPIIAATWVLYLRNAQPGALISAVELFQILQRRIFTPQLFLMELDIGCGSRVREC
jgi:hypothetical protein